MKVANTGPLPERPLVLPPIEASAQETPVTEVDALAPPEMPDTASNSAATDIDPTRFGAANEAPLSQATQFQTEASPDLLRRSIEDFDALPRVQQQRLNDLAVQLDFPNGRTLSHALRNLPEAQLTEWIEAAFSETPNTRLNELSRTAVDTLFADLKAPAPVFHSEDGAEWSAAGYLAIYNSVHGIQQALPAERLRSVLSNEAGEGLQFTRASHPAPSENPDSLLSVLSNSMKIAGTDGHNAIFLYDAALSMNPQDVLNNDQLLGYMERIQAQQPDAVRSLQSMLNATLPASRQIPVNGLLEVDTWAALSEFDHMQMLRQATDILRDSCKDSNQRHRLIDRAENIQRQAYRNGILEVEWNGKTGLDAMEELFEAMGAEGVLQPAGRDRLQRLTTEFNYSTSSRSLRNDQVERLVSNWFGIIDSGEQFDFTEQVITHELGHHLHNEDRLLENWSQISFRAFDQENINMDEFMGTALSMNIDSGFGSDYATLNPREDFAESFRLFQHRPEQLLESNPLKFLFMAGATGAYEGREDALIEFMQGEGGYSTRDIQAAVRNLRGQTSEYWTENANRLSQAGARWLDDSFVQAKILSVAQIFSEEGTLGRLLQSTEDPGALAERITRFVSDATAQIDPAFDNSVSGMLPGLEGALSMSHSPRAILPSQRGYVMDYLKEQLSLAENPDSEQGAAAQALIERFRTEGLNIFPEQVQAQIPENTRQHLSTPEARSAYLTLAYLTRDPQQEAAHGEPSSPENSPQTQESLPLDNTERVTDPAIDLDRSESSLSAFQNYLGEFTENLPNYLSEAIKSEKHFNDLQSRYNASRLSSENLENQFIQMMEKQHNFARQLVRESSFYQLLSSAFEETEQGVQAVQTENNREVVGGLLVGAGVNLERGDLERVSSRVLDNIANALSQLEELPRGTSGRIFDMTNQKLSQILAAELSAEVTGLAPRDESLF